MKIIYDPDKPLDFDTVSTIGIFDGVHLGHRKIIDLIKAEAELKGLRSLVVTFHPHPQTVIRGSRLPLIVPIEERFRLLENSGVDLVVCFRFTREFSALSAREFVVDVLVNKLRIKSIFIGNDFFFGRNREGDIELLRTLGDVHGFSVNIVEPVTIGGEVVSSTAIRNLILDGNVKKVAGFLGYYFSISGVVDEGEKRGRVLGFPTANIRTSWEMLPKIGVYATRAYFDDKRYDSITNIGRRPTFGKNDVVIETHIFDFAGDIYGRTIRVEFIERLRDERRFESMEALSAEIKRDVRKARDILACTV
jgi:riboflavin kinase/FMN adenylyltransferase